jgi:ATP-dependent DNA helicase RecG
MDQKTQQATLQLFKEGKPGFLIATSLIEVGIDIPSANIMVIHSAEMFGLAQLHQLRGRVGRGTKQGFCFLVPTSEEEEDIERLKLMEKYNNGLTLAKKDLKLRGAGEIFGEKQHGRLNTRLKYFWSKSLFLLAKKTAHDLLT